jgi:hypothetical protein
MWNILMYAIPYTLYALAAGFLVTSFLSPMYELIFGNIHDIPAETPYAPGEQIKGGWQ